MKTPDQIVPENSNDEYLTQRRILNSEAQSMHAKAFNSDRSWLEKLIGENKFSEKDIAELEAKWIDQHARAYIDDMRKKGVEVSLTEATDKMAEIMSPSIQEMKYKRGELEYPQ